MHYHNVSLVGGPGVLGYGDALKLYTAHEHYMQTTETHFRAAAHIPDQTATANPRTDETTQGSESTEALDVR